MESLLWTPSTCRFLFSIRTFSLPVHRCRILVVWHNNSRCGIHECPGPRYPYWCCVVFVAEQDGGVLAVLVIFDGRALLYGALHYAESYRISFLCVIV